MMYVALQQDQCCSVLERWKSGQDKRELVNFKRFALADIKGHTFEPDLPANKSCLKLVIYPVSQNTFIYWSTLDLVQRE